VKILNPQLKVLKELKILLRNQALILIANRKFKMSIETRTINHHNDTKSIGKYTQETITTFKDRISNKISCGNRST
jgi:hypothetical protein